MTFHPDLEIACAHEGCDEPAEDVLCHDHKDKHIRILEAENAARKERLDGQIPCATCGSNEYSDGDHVTLAHCTILALKAANEVLVRQLTSVTDTLNEAGRRLHDYADRAERAETELAACRDAHATTAALANDHLDSLETVLVSESSWKARAEKAEARPVVRVIKDAKQWGYDGPVVEVSTPERMAFFGMDATVLGLANWLAKKEAPRP